MAESLTATVDARVRAAALGVNDYFTLAARALRSMVSRPVYWRDVLVQMDRIGVGAIPIVCLTGIFTGMVVALQGSAELQQYGAAGFLGGILGESMVRELAPVLAGLGVAGRSGSAIAAELGAMRVSEQIDALQSFGTDPIRKLVTPRLIAALVMLPVVTILLDMVGVLGGMLVAHGAGVAPDPFFHQMWRAFALNGVAFGFLPRDFIYGIVKAVVFGAIIALTGAYYGLTLEGGSEGVGIATTRSVVTSSILIFTFDYFLTQILLVTMGV